MLLLIVPMVTLMGWMSHFFSFFVKFNSFSGVWPTITPSVPLEVSWFEKHKVLGMLMIAFFACHMTMMPLSYVGPSYYLFILVGFLSVNLENG